MALGLGVQLGVRALGLGSAEKSDSSSGANLFSDLAKTMMSQALEKTPFGQQLGEMLKAFAGVSDQMKDADGGGGDGSGGGGSGGGIGGTDGGSGSSDGLSGAISSLMKSGQNEFDKAFGLDKDANKAGETAKNSTGFQGMLGKAMEAAESAIKTSLGTSLMETPLGQAFQGLQSMEKGAERIGKALSGGTDPNAEVTDHIGVALTASQSEKMKE